MAIENYYALLNMPPSAHEQQLARALKRQCEAGHLSLEQARAIRHILLDPQRRQTYDRILRQTYPQVFEAAEAAADDIAVDVAVSPTGRRGTVVLWLLAVLLPALLLGLWLAVGYVQSRSMSQAALSPAFVAGLKDWLWRDLSLDYDARRGLAINDSLDILSNTRQAKDHPYIAAINDIRTEYRNHGQVVPQPVLWLHNQGLLVGGDVWTLGSSGAHKRFSIVNTAQSRQNRTEVQVLPQRRMVVWATRQKQALHLLFLDSDSGQQISYTLEGRGRPQMADRFDYAPAATVHFSADERYMLVTYPAEDHMWMLDHNQKGQIQNLRYLGSINRHKEDKPAHAVAGLLYRNNTQAVWLESPHAVTVHENGDIHYWSLPQLQLQKTEKLPLGRGEKVRWARFSEDGRQLWLEIDVPMNLRFARYTLADGQWDTFDTHIADPGRKVLGNQYLWLYSWQDKWSRILSAPSQ